jgi:hypothetical protein
MLPFPSRVARIVSSGVSFSSPCKETHIITLHGADSITNLCNVLLLAKISVQTKFVKNAKSMKRRLRRPTSLIGVDRLNLTLTL